MERSDSLIRQSTCAPLVGKCGALCGPTCGRVSLILVLILFVALQVWLQTTDGGGNVSTGVAVCVLVISSYYPGAVVLMWFHLRRGRSRQVNVDVCCRVALLAIATELFFVLFRDLSLGIDWLLAVLLILLLPLCVCCGVMFFQGKRAVDDQWAADYPLPKMEFPGQKMPFWIGLGNWNLRNQWLIWLAILCGAAMLAGTVSQIAFTAVRSDSESRSGNRASAALTMAFFGGALMQEVYKYLLICTCRALATGSPTSDEVLTTSLWSVVAFATFENSVFLQHAVPINRVLAHTSPYYAVGAAQAARSVIRIPSQCCWGLIACLGVCQAYSVPRSTWAAGGFLLAHLLLATLLHGLYDWAFFAFEYHFIQTAGFACCVGGGFLAGCVCYLLLYRTWRRSTGVAEDRPVTLDRHRANTRKANTVHANDRDSDPHDHCSYNANQTIAVNSVTSPKSHAQSPSRNDSASHEGASKDDRAWRRTKKQPRMGGRELVAMDLAASSARSSLECNVGHLPQYSPTPSY